MMYGFQGMKSYGAGRVALLKTAPFVALMAFGIAAAPAPADEPILHDLGTLDAQLAGDADQFSLELFDDVTVQIRPEQATVYSRSLSAWSGRLGDGSDAAAWYTLTRNRDLLVANFWLADGRAFEIRPTDDLGATHLVHEIQPELFAPCLTCEALPGSEPLRVPEQITGSMLSRGCSRPPFGWSMLQKWTTPNPGISATISTICAAG